MSMINYFRNTFSLPQGTNIKKFPTRTLKVYPEDMDKPTKENTEVTTETKKCKIRWEEFDDNVNAILYFFSRLVRAAIIFYVIAAIAPGLRDLMPTFYSIIDGLLAGFDKLISLALSLLRFMFPFV